MNLIENLWGVMSRKVNVDPTWDKDGFGMNIIWTKVNIWKS